MLELYEEIIKIISFRILLKVFVLSVSNGFHDDFCGVMRTKTYFASKPFLCLSEI